MTGTPPWNRIEITPAGTYGARMRGGPLLRASMGAFVGMVRLFRGRGPFKGIALLTTIGATSGKKRTAPVGAFPDGSGRWLVVGSNMGAARHPAWFTNLARNPDQAEIELGGRTTKVTPESLVGPDRADAWQRVIKVSPGFASYEQKTDRLIPVVRLTAVS
jgi:deazaflavin-dependent oxidoreductase (nitroreductase family)